MFVRHDANLPLLQSLNPALFAELTKPVQPEDMLRRNKFSTANEHLIKEALLWFLGEPPDDPRIQEQWLALLQVYPNRIPLMNLRGAIRNRLLELGINPGGSIYEAKWYYETVNDRQAWFACYNWENAVPKPVSNQSKQQSSHINRMEDLLMRELMYALFPHMARTLEGLGQGWVSYHPFQDPSPDTIDVTDAVIRQL